MQLRKILADAQIEKKLVFWFLQIYDAAKKCLLKQKKHSELNSYPYTNMVAKVTSTLSKFEYKLRIYEVEN